MMTAALAENTNCVRRLVLVAPVNPWDATTLEWTVPSPPPHDNFAGKIPVVNHGPYEYSVPGAPRDFVMQTDPPTAHAH